ncbi:MAG: dTMP kinase [Egibacteraceae bacterium]
MDGSATARTSPAGTEPVFLAIEGIDDSGKTTLTAALADVLRGLGLEVATHKEPSDGPIGVVFRRLSAAGGIPPMAMALLSAADRHERQEALAQYRRDCEVILADRYYLSGLAYHAADGINAVEYQGLNRGVRKPTAYLYLDIDPILAAARGSGVSDDYWEQHDIAARLPDAYERGLALIAETEAAQVIRIDASQSPQRVLESALTATLALIPRAPEGNGG